uniref:Uncharacterized protein n=1 Tax=Opuntia streptacantha TaxID=393608 RepID=A0A7C9AZN5_OPUST
MAMHVGFIASFVEFAYNKCRLGFGVGKRGKLMAEVNEILYVVVVQDRDASGKTENGKEQTNPFRYEMQVARQRMEKSKLTHFDMHCRFVEHPAAHGLPFYI